MSVALCVNPFDIWKGKIKKLYKVYKFMLEMIINRYEDNCTTKHRIYTEYYAEK